ncbi:odorant receptor 43a-like [Musca domestica]|uniref:Odorant receptor n=1 Tax=Musca domestica TaxID=7370 RepID=A0A1I8ME38_MUSDO|nr:odorant receptor 43a-like [Musca domestica]
MMEENRMVSINIKIWKFFAIIYPTSDKLWRLYSIQFVTILLNFMQFMFLIEMWGNLAPFILNVFYVSATFDCLLRTGVIVYNRSKFEAFLAEFDSMYSEIEENGDDYAKGKLKEATEFCRKFSLFNVLASFLDLIGTMSHPILTGTRTHPFGVALPGIDSAVSPYYEIYFILQLHCPITLSVLYMPFVSIFVTFSSFGKTALQILQHRLKDIFEIYDDDETRLEALKECAHYYNRLTRFIKVFDEMVTYVILGEFLLFGAIICSLLFCINIIDTMAQFVSIIMYVGTMLYVLFACYYSANEMLEESLKVSEAAYSIPWYEGTPQFRKTLLLFIQRTQKPLCLTVGNVYPMTLLIFQSLLNMSYSYFTMLRGLKIQ